MFGLHLPNYRLKIDHAIAMVRELDSLKELQFQMRNSKCSQLLSQLDGDCEATRVLLKRKIEVQDGHRCKHATTEI